MIGQRKIRYGVHPCNSAACIQLICSGYQQFASLQLRGPTSSLRGVRVPVFAPAGSDCDEAACKVGASGTSISSFHRPSPHPSPQLRSVASPFHLANRITFIASRKIGNGEEYRHI